MNRRSFMRFFSTAPVAAAVAPSAPVRAEAVAALEAQVWQLKSCVANAEMEAAMSQSLVEFAGMQIDVLHKRLEAAEAPPLPRLVSSPIMLVYEPPRDEG